MILIFCKGKSIGSDIIADIDGGPHSHVAIASKFVGRGEIVAHSTHNGVTIVHKKEFKEHYTINSMYEVPLYFQNEISEETYFLALLQSFIDRPYDYLALLYLGLYKLGIMRKNNNIWQNRNYFICTEFATRAILGHPDSMMGLIDLEKYVQYRLANGNLPKP